jgi:hypothetical protein
MIKIKDFASYLILLHSLVVDGHVPIPVGILAVDFPLEARFGIGEHVNHDDSILALEETKLLNGSSSKLIEGLGFD